MDTNAMLKKVYLEGLNQGLAKVAKVIDECPLATADALTEIIVALTTVRDAAMARANSYSDCGNPDCSTHAAPNPVPLPPRKGLCN